MKISSYTQITPLDLRRDIVKPEGGRGLFQVLHEYRVQFKIEDDEGVESEWITHTVPAGFYTDLASIPVWVPKWIAQKVGPHIEAAVVHDHIYEALTYPKEVADALFRYIMDHDGVNGFMSWYMYTAVRLGGKGAYGG